MSFKIGDNVMLVSAGIHHDEFKHLVGRVFKIESTLRTWPNTDAPPDLLMHQIGPPPRGHFVLIAEPNLLMKIYPPDDMRGLDEQCDLHDALTQ